jgi:hypothetical protein
MTLNSPPHFNGATFGAYAGNTNPTTQAVATSPMSRCRYGSSLGASGTFMGPHCAMKCVGGSTQPRWGLDHNAVCTTQLDTLPWYRELPANLNASDGAWPAIQQNPLPGRFQNYIGSLWFLSTGYFDYADIGLPNMGVQYPTYMFKQTRLRANRKCSILVIKCEVETPSNQFYKTANYIPSSWDATPESAPKMWLLNPEVLANIGLSRGDEYDIPILERAEALAGQGYLTFALFDYGYDLFARDTDILSS